MTVTGCTLSGNAAIGEAGGDGVVNFGSGQGGGINDFDNLTVVNSTLIGNQALGTPLAPSASPRRLLTAVVRPPAVASSASASTSPMPP